MVFSSPCKDRTETTEYDDFLDHLAQVQLHISTYRENRNLNDVTTMTLEIDQGGEDAEDDITKPLGERVVEAVQAVPDRIIRPARLAAVLGISVNEACAELCGLMAAVGGGNEGASFTFEKMPQGSAPVMVFSFPPDFAQRALRNRRQQERWRDWQEFFHVLVRGLKIVTAFGLILSLFILLVAAVVGVVAVLVASQNNDRGGRGRALVLHQLHSLFFTFRQLLWCYALFGPDMGEGEDQRDPFLRETAYDLALLCSVCCGNPGSLFFWIRARQLSNRRHHIYRNWSSTTTGVAAPWDRTNHGNYNSGVEGVTLVRRGTWGSSGSDHGTIVTSETEHRGLLSVAVEFLFGPTPFHPPQAEADKWKLRAAVVVQTCCSSAKGGISLAELVPYADQPPLTLDDTAQVVQQGLLQVAFLNGIPKETDVMDATTTSTRAVFCFPELMAESATILRYEPRLEDESLDGSFLSTLFVQNTYASTRASRLVVSRGGQELPKYLKEPYYQFTKLTSEQFMYCLGLGFLNAVGVFSLAQSLQPNGALGPLVQGTLFTIVVGGILPVLTFYAKLFFVLPVGRSVLVSYLNHVRRRRNARREILSRQVVDP